MYASEEVVYPYPTDTPMPEDAMKTVNPVDSGVKRILVPLDPSMTTTVPVEPTVNMPGVPVRVLTCKCKDNMKYSPKEEKCVSDDMPPSKCKEYMYYNSYTDECVDSDVCVE